MNLYIKLVIIMRMKNDMISLSFSVWICICVLVCVEHCMHWHDEMAPQPWADPLHSILWGESYLGFCKILSHYPPIQTETKSCYSRSAKHQNSHHQYNDWCLGFDVMIFKQKTYLSYSFFYDVSFWRDFQLDLISVFTGPICQVYHRKFDKLW